MTKIVTFGEIMMRVVPPDVCRFRQALPGSVGVSFAGAEANVAASIRQLGGAVAFVSALPDHAIADACVGVLTNLGIDTRHVLRTNEGRLGIYFLETGANQRPSGVIYDRDGSSISMQGADAYDWPTIFQGARWFHTSGITPAISRDSAAATLAAVKQAKEAGTTVSCDLNFRKKLWRWEPDTAPRELAQRTMQEVLEFVDVVIANEEDCSDVLGIEVQESDVHSGRLSIDRFADVARQVAQQFPGVSQVAITLRESISASHNNWGAMLYEAATDTPRFAPMDGEKYRPYEIKNIVDRVGAGDAFAAGLIFAQTTPELSQPDDALRFAVASSCLAHSILGDFNYVARSEVESLMGGSASGRIVR